MTKISSAKRCNHACKPSDGEPPPTPDISLAIATAGIAKDGSPFYPNLPPTPPAATRDPAYIEISNWEPGTKIQIINLSRNPAAKFSNASDVVTLQTTGRDVEGRIASAWINDATMKKTGLNAGSEFLLRVVDEDGNASSAVSGRLEGRSYGQMGRIQEGDVLVPGSSVRLLDGEAKYASRLLKHISDTTAPETKLFARRARLVGDGEGVRLSAPGALEPQCSVMVTNARTGDVFSGTVGADQGLELSLGMVASGDSLFVRITDASGVAADPIELRYSKKCKDGRASTLGILSSRLEGVLDGELKPARAGRSLKRVAKRAGAQA
ncbi:MAG: hypothetical protein HYV07_21245 [Deltaproteobacteria bacterium]|nr:hypothetical protein [Deltaproteobacteria bacterium]